MRVIKTAEHELKSLLREAKRVQKNESTRQPEKLIVPKDLGDWLDTRDIGNKSLMFTLIDQLREQLKDEFSGEAREFVFDYKKEIIEVIIGIRDYEVEEPLVYALVKEWEMVSESSRYWNWYKVGEGSLHFNSSESSGNYITKMTESKWNELGVNTDNAVFKEEPV